MEMTYCAAMPFTPADGGGVAPGQPVDCASEGAAVRRAEVMSCQQANAGAVAFSRCGDPNLGDFEDAVVLKTYGELPDDFVYGRSTRPECSALERPPRTSA
jgi:hypothetical protein